MRGRARLGIIGGPRSGATVPYLPYLQGSPHSSLRKDASPCLAARWPVCQPEVPVSGPRRPARCCFKPWLTKPAGGRPGAPKCRGLLELEQVAARPAIWCLIRALRSELCFLAHQAVTRYQARRGSAKRETHNKYLWWTLRYKGSPTAATQPDFSSHLRGRNRQIYFEFEKNPSILLRSYPEIRI